MENSLAAIIAKNKDRLVDKASTSLKVMFGVAYADVAQEDLEERLYRVFDAVEEITRQSAVKPELIEDITEGVMVSPIYGGWDNHDMTEEVLQVIDMVVNQQLATTLAAPEKADDRQASQALLAQTIRTAKELVNGDHRRLMEERKKRGERWAFFDTTPKETDSAEKAQRLAAKEHAQDEPGSSEN